ncbi:MAG: Short-chain dehydrogenase [Bacteroidota bacterium]|nr:Short-chain dehydrogenase [Bacteroidota bacterium]
MSQITDSLFIVTGAASGIGRALAIKAAKEGAKVIACDINENSLDETMSIISGSAEKYVLDISQLEHINIFASEILAKYPQQNIILVNNAGVALTSGTFAETSLEDFEWLMNINLWGAIRMTKAFLPEMIKNNSGHIVNVSSIFGVAGMPNNSAYCTAKFGVKGFSDVLKSELLGSNIRISSVHPGGIKTNIARDSRISSSQNIDEVKAMISKFEKVALKMPPEQAADVILNGIKKNKPRILIGNDAKTLDYIVRIFPDTYHKIIAKVFKL